MKFFKLYKSYLSALTGIASFMSVLAIGLLVLFFAYSNEAYAAAELEELTAEYGSVEEIPQDKINDITQPFNLFEPILLGGMCGGSFSMFKEMYGISLQNSVSRKSLRRGFLLIAGTFALILAAVLILCMIGINTLFEYTQASISFDSINNDITDSSALKYLLRLCEFTVEGVLASVAAAFLYMASTKYSVRKLFGASFVLMLGIAGATVYADVNDKPDVILIMLAAYLALMIIGFVRLTKSISLECRF